MMCDSSNIALPEEKAKEEEQEDDKSITPDGRKEEHVPPVKGFKGKAEKLQAEGKKEKRKSSAKGRPTRRSSTHAISPPPGAPTPASDADGRYLAN